MMKTRTAVVLAVVILTSWFAVPAHAATGTADMQDRVDTVLAANPGGKLRGTRSAGTAARSPSPSHPERPAAA